jgi:hypothetical protein
VALADCVARSSGVFGKLVQIARIVQRKTRTHIQVANLIRFHIVSRSFVFTSFPLTFLIPCLHLSCFTSRGFFFRFFFVSPLVFSFHISFTSVSHIHIFSLFLQLFGYSLFQLQREAVHPAQRGSDGLFCGSGSDERFAVCGSGGFHQERQTRSRRFALVLDRRKKGIGEIFVAAQGLRNACFVFLSLF